MNEPVDELYSLLIPLHKDRLIVPRSCVAEVIRYAMPAGEAEGPAWFRGLVSWNDKQVPVVSFEDVCGRESVTPGARTRIAVFYGMSGKLDSGFFGILTEGFPQLVRVNREVMKRDDQQSWPDDGPVICQIKMINEYPLIPDLEVLEGLIEKSVPAGQSVV